MKPQDIAIVDDETEPMHGVEVRIIETGGPAPYSVLVEETKSDRVDGGVWFAPSSLRLL